MQLFKKIIHSFLNVVKSEKESLVSRNFTISIATLYSLLIIMLSGSFFYVQHLNQGILHDLLINQGMETAIEKVDTIIERLRYLNVNSVKNVKREIININNEDKNIYTVIIYAKTGDENYFRIREIIPGNNEILLSISKNDTVRETKEINFLKKGLLYTSVDPDIYSYKQFYWRNVYHPYKIKKHSLVIQFMVSATGAHDTSLNYNISMNKVKKILVASILILIIAVIIITIIFTQNYSLLIKNLSTYMKKAADGDLNVNLRTTEDAELNQLALSFNSLIDELKDKSDRTQETEKISDIFKTGVSLLKENRLDDAISIFKTLQIIKPGGFGSYFNLGVAHAKKKEYSRSLAMFQKALEVNPNYEITIKYIDKVKKMQDTVNGPGQN